VYSRSLLLNLLSQGQFQSVSNFSVGLERFIALSVLAKIVKWALFNA
jgi:hypothetical protein